jgi:hypothetical protein
VTLPVFSPPPVLVCGEVEQCAKRPEFGGSAKALSEQRLILCDVAVKSDA